MRRIWAALFKYLARDPIYDNYTMPIAVRIFNALYFPQFLTGLILSIVSFNRYYAYIA